MPDPFGYVASNPAQALLLAQNLHLLRSPDPRSALYDSLESARPNIRGVQFFPVTATHPAWALATWNDLAIVLYDGVSLADHGVAYAAAATSGAGVSPTFDANNYLRALAAEVIVVLQAARFEQIGKCILAGHSLGGAVCQVLHAASRVAGANFDFRTIAIGSPRPGGPACARALFGTDVARFMNHVDPVPLILPRRQEAPLAYAALTNEAALRWQNYDHPQGGIVLYPDGSAENRDVPVFASADVQPAILSWIAGAVRGLESVHGLPSYVQYLTARVNAVRVGAAGVRGTHRAEPTQEISPTQMRRYTQRDRELLTAASSAARQVVMTWPKIEGFKVVRYGESWAIEWQQYVVVIAASKRQAKSFAARGNAWLRQLQKVALFYRADFMEALVVYIARASDPNGTFNPPLPIPPEV